MVGFNLNSGKLSAHFIRLGSTGKKLLSGGYLLAAINTVLFVASSFYILGRVQRDLFNDADGIFSLAMAATTKQWDNSFWYFSNNPVWGLGDISYVYKFSWIAYAISQHFDHVYLVTVYFASSCVTFFGTYIGLRLVNVRYELAWFTSWLLVLLVFPFLHYRMVFPVTLSSPNIMELVALAFLSIGLFFHIGRHHLFVDILLVFLIMCLELFILLNASSGAVLFIPTICLFYAVFWFSTREQTERRRKFIAGLIIALFIMVCIFPTILGHALYSIPAHVNIGRAAPISLMLMYISSLFHFNTTHFHIIASPYVFVLSCFGQIFSFYLPRRSPLRILGIATFAITWFYLGLGILFNLILMPHFWGIPPIYLEYLLWPFHYLFAGFFIIGYFRILTSAHVADILRDHLSRLAIARVTYAVILIIAAAIIRFGALAPERNTAELNRTNMFRATNYKKSVIEEIRISAKKDLLTFLENHIAISPTGDRNFAGAVATYSGFHKDCASWEDQSGELPYSLWAYNIPTLAEYNQHMSPFLYIMHSRFLTRRCDEKSRNVLVSTLINKPLLRLWGVRYLLTHKKPIEAADLPRIKFPESYFLHEIPAPNTGNYSPTRITFLNNADSILAFLSDRNRDFSKEATATSGSFSDLQPASLTAFAPSKNGYVLRATSKGTSLLVLPLLYSNCLRIENLDSRQDPPQIVRVNLQQAGLVFKHAAAIRIQYQNGPFNAPYCRIRDSLELKKILGGKKYDIYG